MAERDRAEELGTEIERYEKRHFTLYADGGRS